MISNVFARAQTENLWELQEIIKNQGDSPRLKNYWWTQIPKDGVDAKTGKLLGLPIGTVLVGPGHPFTGTATTTATTSRSFRTVALGVAVVVARGGCGGGRGGG